MLTLHILSIAGVSTAKEAIPGTGKKMYNEQVVYRVHRYVVR